MFRSPTPCNGGRSRHATRNTRAGRRRRQPPVTPHHLAAGCALPGRAGEVTADHAIAAGVGEQHGVRRDETPVRAVPAVDLHARRVRMEDQLVAIRNLQIGADARDRELRRVAGICRNRGRAARCELRRSREPCRPRIRAERSPVGACRPEGSGREEGERTSHPAQCSRVHVHVHPTVSARRARRVWSCGW